jgi:hypothetical protein
MQWSAVMPIQQKDNQENYEKYREYSEKVEPESQKSCRR